MLHLRDSPDRKSLAVEDHSIRQVAKGLAIAIGVASGRLHTGQLDGEGGLCLPCQSLGSRIEGHSPVVDIGIIRIRPNRVALAAKDAPVHVVKVSSDVTLADVKVDAVREVLREIMHRPVQTVLVRRVAARRVSGLAVAELAAAPVWRANAPELCTGGLGDPGRRCCCGGSCFHDYAVLRVLPENAVAVDCQAVGSSLDAGYSNGAVGADIAPVLV